MFVNLKIPSKTSALDGFFKVYSGMLKSELVWLLDVLLLAQFQTVWFSESVRNLNDFVRILDKNFCLKMESPQGLFHFWT